MSRHDPMKWVNIYGDWYHMRIGIDLGGTKISIIALDDGGNISFEARVKTPQNDYRGTISALRDLVTTAETATGQRASVGLGMPGSLSPRSNLVQNANSTWLNGQPLKDDLQDALSREIRLANDANCFALSEATDGAGRDHNSVFGVILGTGCGGGLIHNKQLKIGRASCRDRVLRLV